MSIRRIASQWNYKVIRHIETSSGFARQLMVEGADKNGQKFVAATSMFVDIVDGKIARIDEYFNPTDVACLLEAMPT